MLGNILCRADVEVFPGLKAQDSVRQEGGQAHKGGTSIQKLSGSVYLIVFLLQYSLQSLSCICNNHHVSIFFLKHILSKICVKDTTF